jgi:hypothetical protein
MQRAMMVLAIGAVLAGGLLSGFGRAAEKHKEQPMLAHDVYFTLTDASAAAKQQLVDACRKYLSGHPGSVWFSVGLRAPEFTRDVNNLEFDVALHVVFTDKAAHDRYQQAERHMQFIQESKPNWKKVQVFDSYVEASSTIH